MNYDIKSYTCSAFEMRYLRFGKGEKNLVIIPGLSVKSVLEDANSIVSAYEAFTDCYSVYLFDRIENPHENYSIHDMAEDTVKVINYLGLNNIFCFGASQGGMIALDIAIHHKDIFRKMFLASTAAFVDRKAFESIDRWLSFSEKRDGVSLYLDFCKKLYPEDLFLTYKSFFENQGRSITEFEFKKFSVLAEALKSFDIRHLINKISCETYFTGVLGDEVLGPSAITFFIDLADTVPNFHAYVYEGFTHAVYDLAPDFKSRMLEFFETD